VSPFVAGQTGLIAAVAAAEPVVGPARSAYDGSAPYGVPAHVTVLFPFLRHDAVDAAVLAGLGRICASVPAFDVSFAEVRRWPGVAYLAPDPDPPFRELTRAVAARWPDHQPYGGEFEDVVPHLTIAEGDDEVLDAAQRMVGAGLPIAARVERVDLIAFDGSRWASVAAFRLGVRLDGTQGWRRRMTLPPPRDVGAPIDVLVAELAARIGARPTVDACAALLSGSDPQEYADLLPYLAGAPAQALLRGEWPLYWARFWGSRGLLRVWDRSAVPAVVAALGDPEWRPAEGALRIATRHEVAEAADGAARLARHDLPRVRATALRALGAAGDTEHVGDVLSRLGDEHPDVRRAAARALERMVPRLDLDPDLLEKP
jgi:2'-5' RNA ligase